MGGARPHVTVLGVAQPKTAARSTHLAGIDGLRAFAALAVLCSHTSELSIGSPTRLGKVAAFGDQGLTLFFAISGFLLYLPSVSALLAGRPQPSIRRFARNRVLRIFPAYIVIFLIALAVGALSVHGVISDFDANDVGRITQPWVLVANLFMLQTLFPHSLGTGIIPAWSLTAELTFYALLPLVGYVAWRLARRTGKAVALAVGPLVFIGISGVTMHEIGRHTQRLSTAAVLKFTWGSTWSAVLARSFFAQADLFAYGMLAALAIGLARHRDKVPRLPRLVHAAAVVALVVVAVLARIQGGRVAISLVGVCAAGVILLTVLPGHDGASPTGGRGSWSGDLSVMWA